MKRKSIKAFTLLVGAILCSSCMLSACGSTASANDYLNDYELNANLSAEQGGETTPATVYTPYKVVTSDSGKDYIADKKGNAVICLSAHLLTDLYVHADFWTVAQLEPYFKLARDTGFNTVEVPILWNQVETEKNVYSATVVNQYLDFAKQYNLKINFVWYGSARDGQTLGYCVPDYILKDPTTYKVIKDLFDGGVYGRWLLLKWDDRDLMRRESRALFQMLNFVGEWNEENGETNPLVQLQIGQGLDRLYRWRIRQYSQSAANKFMTEDAAKEMIVNYYTAMASAVKASNYRALVRAEFCEQTAVNKDVKDIAAIEGVDLVSPTYLKKVAVSRNAVNNFATKLEGVPVLNSEDWASDIVDRQILTALLSGGIGYATYALAPSIYYPVGSEGSLYGRYDANTQSFPEIGYRVKNTKATMGMISKAPWTFSTVETEGIAALGMHNLMHGGDVLKTYLISESAIEGGKQKCVYVDYTVPTASDALGFVSFSREEYGYYLYFYSAVNSTISFKGCDILYAQKGTQNANGTFNVTEELENFSNTFNAEAGTLYRVKVTNVIDKPSNKELLNSGYIKSIEALRG